jgi:hypothetical protein
MKSGIISGYILHSRRLVEDGKRMHPEAINPHWPRIPANSSAANARQVAYSGVRVWVIYSSGKNLVSEGGNTREP